MEVNITSFSIILGNEGRNLYGLLNIINKTDKYQVTTFINNRYHKYLSIPFLPDDIYIQLKPCSPPPSFIKQALQTSKINHMSPSETPQLPSYLLLSRQ